MAITELVFPPLKNTEEARAGFFEKVPDLMRPIFHNDGGPMSVSLARVLESSPADAEDHRGYMAVITWESFEKIKEFLKKPEFAEFKQSLSAYNEGPPVLQFFDAAPGVAVEKTIQGTTHFFVIKAIGDGEQVLQAKKQWENVTAAFSGVAGDGVKFHYGDGLQNVEGQFAGFSGWSSLEVLETALDDPKVKEQLDALRESGADISTFTLELKHVF
ncbi:hypothetical protein CkaCkLH20_07467 [Colletotrichum karsti]|uniref:ABM domain-containing protein n=1 Tax=Colletotrichum karsti TaxID=1095194 RepID=A0A9P6I547_9PEZI|nr:uncharacterized protein CkaCkLH20_07467 [Colletotrichum karsti]KAF9875201.1 hypothetical protein CkaCkLH20_07467 [Colletotrichum karsti]